MSTAGNLEGFDARTVEPSAGFDPLPAGDYEAVIVASERKATAAGDGHYLKLQFQILNGLYQNRVLFENLNLWNKHPKAVEIAKGNLSAICRALNILTPKDSADLHNKPLKIRVKITKDGEYGEQNKITAYKPRNSGPALASPALATTLDSPPNATPWPMSTETPSPAYQETQRQAAARF